MRPGVAVERDIEGVDHPEWAQTSARRQVEISRWFGEIESRPFSKHPASPHPDVFRVSNVRSEGCTGVGRTGWHIDGSFMECPYQVSVYHMHAVPKTGATKFIPLAEVIERMPAEQRAKWERLWMVGDRRSGPSHPVRFPMLPRGGQKAEDKFGQGVAGTAMENYQRLEGEGIEPRDRRCAGDIQAPQNWPADHVPPPRHDCHLCVGQGHATEQSGGARLP